MNTQQPGVFEVLHSLRSIHGNFSDKPVAEEDMRKILDSCVRAANSSSRQPYSIIRIQDRALMKEVCTFSAPQCLVFLADYTRLRDVADLLGYELLTDSLDDMVTLTIDASIAAQNAVVAAKALGVDSLITNSIQRGDPDRLKRLLNFPDTACVPLFSVLFGYPNKEPDQHGRYMGPGLLHEEVYQRMTEDEIRTMSAQYDDPSRHMGLSFVDWRAKGFKSYFEWFMKDWATTKPKNPTPEQEAQARKRQDNMWILAERAGFVKRS